MKTPLQELEVLFQRKRRALLEQDDGEWVSRLSAAYEIARSALEKAMGFAESGSAEEQT